MSRACETGDMMMIMIFLELTTTSFTSFPCETRSNSVMSCIDDGFRGQRRAARGEQTAEITQT